MAGLNEQYDVAIVGAGIAGSALACALSVASDSQSGQSSKPPLRIALIEAQNLPEEWPPCESDVNGFDPRVSALTIASQNLLERIGAWPAIAQQRVSPFEQMQVWDAEGTGEIAFDAADVRSNVLGHIVENRVTVAALVNRLRENANIQIFQGQPVADLLLADPKTKSPDSKSQQISLADGTVIYSTLVVAADGANSPLRKMAGLTTREWDYQHDALVCTVAVEHQHQKTAWQRFTPYGPLAFLPLSASDQQDQFCSIVWSQTGEQTEQAMALDDAEFCQALGQAFEHKLGKVQSCSKRFSFPLRQRHAIDYVKPGFALLADAAHTIHPLAGQGINLGLADVAVLSECILTAHARGQSIADIEVLSRYQRERKADNLAMMTAVEGFKRLFAPLPLPLRWLRNAGMSALDKRGAIKNRIIKHAMGIN